MGQKVSVVERINLAKCKERFGDEQNQNKVKN